jgi:hypothetical protein
MVYGIRNLGGEKISNQGKWSNDWVSNIGQMVQYHYIIVIRLNFWWIFFLNINFPIYKLHTQVSIFHLVIFHQTKNTGKLNGILFSMLYIETWPLLDSMVEWHTTQ